MDDEAIRTAYKRNFYDSDQKLLIQMLNMYRDNFNVYGMAIPNFYSLDRDLRDLVKIHIYMIRRGVGVVHIAKESLYSDDCWDVKYNKKIEESWAKKKMKNPDFHLPYHKLTTFRGYIYFNDLTDRQRNLYEEIKQTKRKAVYETEMKGDSEEENFYDKVFERVLNGGITKDMLQEICLISGKKMSAVQALINVRLKDKGSKETLSVYLKKNENLHNKTLLEKGASKPRI